MKRATHSVPALGTNKDERVASASVPSATRAYSVLGSPATLTITDPTTSSWWTTYGSPITLKGTASNCLLVAWSNALTGQNGSATGTTSWIATIPLWLGTNEITMAALPEVGDPAIDSIKVDLVPDTIPPTASITINGGAAYTSSSGVTLALSAADNIGVVAYKCWNAGSTEPAWTNAAPPGSVASWSLTSGDGAKTVYFKVKDAAKNEMLASDTIMLDSTPPAVTISAPSSTLTASGPISYTITYAGADTIALSPSQVVLNKTGTANGSVAVSGTGTMTRTVAISIITGDGTLGISLVAGTASDLAGNQAPAAGPSATFTVDTIPPTGSVVINGNAVYATFVDVTLTLDAVGASQMRISNDNATWSSFEPTAASKSWSLLSGDGTKTVYVQLKDGAGNTATTSDTILFDTTAPTVTIDQAVTQGDPTNVSTINLAVVFSEPVSNFATGDVALSGTAGATTAVVTGSGTTYAVAVSGMTSNGMVIANVLAGVATDAAGNSNAASTSTDNTVTYDTLPPSSSSIVINGDATYATSTSVTLTLSATGASQMSFSNGESWSADETYGTSKNWTLSSGDGTKTVYVQFKDNAGNTTGVSDSILLDTYPPDTTLTQSPPNPSNSSSATFGFSASETSCTFERSLDGSPWSSVSSPFTFTGLADGNHDLQVRATDAAGNVDPQPASHLWTIDTQPPTVTITSPTSDPNYTTPADSIVLAWMVAENLGLSSVGWENSSTGASGSTTPTVGSTAVGVALAYGSNTILVKATDMAGNAATDMITVLRNTSPVANDQSVTTAEDTTKEITLTGSDADYGQVLTFAVVTSPAHGILSGTAPNVTYTPLPNYNGPDSFTFKTNDGYADSLSATVTITVTYVNDPPTITGIANQTINEDGSTGALTFTVGDVETAAGSLAVTATSDNAAVAPDGNIVLGGSGADRTVTVTPMADQFGSATITLTVTDADSGSGIISFSVIVMPVNDPPTAVGDSATVPEDSPSAAIYVLANDSTPDAGETLSVIAVGPAAHGTTQLMNGAVKYTPAANYNGPDSFTYTIGDGNGGNATATVSVTVMAVNDPPVISTTSLPNAQETQAYSAQIVASDVDSPSLASSATGLPSWLSIGSSGLISGTAPQASADQTFSLTVTVTDGTTPVSQNLSLTLVAVNDPPGANNDSYGVDEDTVLSVAAPGILANDTDIDSSALTAVLIAGPSPSQGTLALNSNGSFSFTPAPNFNGTIGFTYKADDGTSQSDAATVSITIATVNDGPVAEDKTVIGLEDSAQSFALKGTDADNDVLTYTIVSAPSHGTLGGTAPNLTYTPATNYNGPDSFTFKVNDGSVDSNIATVSIAVTAVNDPPTASAESLSTNQNTPLQITLTANDPDGPALTYSILSGPSHGILSGTTPNLTYTPAVGYAGLDSFIFQASDGSASASALVSIAINDVTSPTVSVSSAGVSPIAFALSFSESVSGLSMSGISLTNGSGILSGSGSSYSITVVPAAPGAVTCKVNAGAATDPAGNPNLASNVASAIYDNDGAPAAPQLLSPGDGAQLATCRPPLDWSDVADSTGVTYQAVAEPMTPAIPSLFAASGLTASDVKTGVLLAGAYQWRVRAADGAGNAGPWSETRSFTILFGITTTQLPTGEVGAPYETVVGITGGTPPFTFAVSSGMLPPGLALTLLTGKILGTPTAPGSYAFTIFATDANSLQTSQDYTIPVNGPILPLNFLSEPPLPYGTGGLSYAHLFEATGGLRPFTWSITSGPLPDGLAFSSTTGLLSGTPTAGNSLITVTVTDTAGTSASKTFALLVVSLSSNLAIASPYPMVGGFVQLPAIVAGTPFSTRFFAAGVVLWSVTSGALAPGLTFDPATGRLYGTSTATGTYRFVVRAIDAAGANAYLPILLTVTPNDGLTLVILPTAAPAGAPGSPYTLTLTAAGGAVPYTWAVISGALPPDLVVDAATGEIFGTPESWGIWSFVVLVSDSIQTATREFSISTGPPPPVQSTQEGGNEGGGGCGCVGWEAVILFLFLALMRKSAGSTMR